MHAKLNTHILRVVMSSQAMHIDSHCHVTSLFDLYTTKADVLIINDYFLYFEELIFEKSVYSCLYVITIKQQTN